VSRLTLATLGVVLLATLLAVLTIDAALRSRPDPLTIFAGLGLVVIAVRVVRALWGSVGEDQKNTVSRPRSR
jgi:cytochrome b